MLYLKQKSCVGIKALLINKRVQSEAKDLDKHANQEGGGKKKRLYRRWDSFLRRSVVTVSGWKGPRKMCLPYGCRRSAWGAAGASGDAIRRRRSCRPPDGSPTLGGLQQASVVRHDLVLRQVQVELESHQDGELEGYQLSAVHSEPLLQFLWGGEEQNEWCGPDTSLWFQSSSLLPQQEQRPRGSAVIGSRHKLISHILSFSFNSSEQIGPFHCCQHLSSLDHHYWQPFNFSLFFKIFKKCSCLLLNNVIYHSLTVVVSSSTEKKKNFFPEDPSSDVLEFVHIEQKCNKNNFSPEDI